MDSPKVIEAVLANTFKTFEFRKRARNWFRTTDAGVYQVVNLQRSPWGGGNCHLNLGWDPMVDVGSFVPEYQCMASIRAEYTEVIPPTLVVRSDGASTLQMPGISLLDTDMAGRFSEGEYRDRLEQVIAQPLARFMERTSSMPELVPLFTRHPGNATLRLRDYLRSIGVELPTRN